MLYYFNRNCTSVQYVFHEGFEAGGNEKDDIHCKAKLDIDGYTEVEHLQV